MLIKITGITDDKLGNFDAKNLTGDRLDGEGEWSKKFFANNLKLQDELSEFGIGDKINVKMKQNGKYWDLTGFEMASEALIEKVTGGAGGKPTHVAGNAAGGAGGGFKGGKGTWTPDPNKDRGVSLRYAIDSVIATKDVKGMDFLTFTHSVNLFMKVYVDLMTGKDPFNDAGTDDAPKQGDGLNPPMQSDEDIPF